MPKYLISIEQITQLIILKESFVLLFTYFWRKILKRIFISVVALNFLIASDNDTTLTFEATEGTLISVDVSPNGRTIAFDLLGHIC